MSKNTKTTSDLILKALVTGSSLTTKELALATKKSPVTVNRYAGKLAALGTITKQGGAYRIAEVTPDLTDYDFIVVSTSGGKDSQTTMRLVANLAREAGVLDRVVALHANLGERVEWDDAPELAEEQALANGVERFICVTRIGGTAQKDGKVYSKGETFGDLVDYSERRGSWPSKSVRFCTSEFKRGPSEKVYTRLAAEWRASDAAQDRPCRILDCMGIRGQESISRAEKPQLAVRKSTKNQHVDTWLPIKHWTTEQVWEDIRESGVRHHWAYDKGMKRLSCVFCVFAGMNDLLIAGKENPKKLEEWAAAEERMGHRFQQNLSLAEVREMLAAAPDLAAQGSFSKPCDDLCA